MPLVNISSYSEDFGRSIQLPKCNRGACTNTFAPCFNKGTNTYYCVDCARDINYAPVGDGTYLCEIPTRDALARMEDLWYEGQVYVGTQTLEQANLPLQARGSDYPGGPNLHGVVDGMFQEFKAGRRTVGAYRGAKGKGGV